MGFSALVGVSVGLAAVEAAAFVADAGVAFFAASMDAFAVALAEADALDRLVRACADWVEAGFAALLADFLEAVGLADAALLTAAAVLAARLVVAGLLVGAFAVPAGLVVLALAGLDLPVADLAEVDLMVAALCVAFAGALPTRVFAPSAATGFLVTGFLAPVCLVTADLEAVAFAAGFLTEAFRAAGRFAVAGLP